MTAAATPNLEQEDQAIRSLLRDLHQPTPLIFWADLLGTALVGWLALLFTVFGTRSSPLMFASGLTAVFAMYRGLCFIHEISHLNSRALQGFETVWNLCFGFPLLMPSFVYVGVHQYHHKLATYGTKQDPEYLPFAQNALMTVVFALQSFLVPVFLMARFLLLTPIGVVLPRFQSWLIVHASSLTMNIAFQREKSPALIARVRLQSFVIFLLWISIAALTAAHVVPIRFWIVWLLVSSVASFVNTLRTLGAHHYQSSGQSMDRHSQLLDSIDTPGGFWTELWAPVGLRFHALHHYFPGIPYHNLPKAYRCLVSHLEPTSAYRQVQSRSLPHSLTALISKGLRQTR